MPKSQIIQIDVLNGPSTIVLPDGRELIITPKPEIEITLEELYEVIVKNGLAAFDEYGDHLQLATKILLKSFLTDLNKLGYKIVKQWLKLSDKYNACQKLLIYIQVGAGINPKDKKAYKIALINYYKATGQENRIKKLHP